MDRHSTLSLIDVGLILLVPWLSWLRRPTVSDMRDRKIESSSLSGTDLLWRLQYFDCAPSSPFKILNLLFFRHACASLFYRLHHAGWVHNSVAQRNIVFQPCTFLSLRLVTFTLKGKKAPHVQVLVHPLITDGFNHNLLVTFIVAILTLQKFLFLYPT